MAPCLPCRDYSSEMLLFCSEEDTVRRILHFLQLACMPLDSWTEFFGLSLNFQCLISMDLIFAWSFLWMLTPFCSFFFFYFKHFSFHCRPPALRFYWKARTCYYLFLPSFMYILEGMRPTSTMIIFVWNFSRIGICMLYEVASVRAHGMPEMNISLLPWADDAAIR